jgi:hypothetical protein
MEVLSEAMQSTDKEKYYEETEVTLTMKNKDEETYSTKDFQWDYSASGHRGKGARGNWKILEKRYNRKGEVSGTEEIQADYDQYWKIQTAMDSRKELPPTPGFWLKSEHPLTFTAQHLNAMRTMEMVISTYLSPKMPETLGLYSVLEDHPDILKPGTEPFEIKQSRTPEHGYV